MDSATIFGSDARDSGDHPYVHRGTRASPRILTFTALSTAFVIVLQAVSCFGEPASAEQGPAERLNTQFAWMIQVETAVKEWCRDHQGLPETLAQLVEAEGYLDDVPEDLYAPGRVLSYRVAKGKRLGVIYSYGPDGDDDRGVSIPVYRIHASGPPPDGDIVFYVKPRHPLLDAFSPSGYVAPDVSDILLDIRDQDGRENAMILYVDAGELWPGTADETQAMIDLSRKVLDEGWDPQAKILLPYLAKYEPMFAKIREGTRVGYARNIGITNGPGTPIPDFMAIQTGAKMLCIQGRYLEHEEKYDEALENYMTALTMGRDIGSPGGYIIHGLISVRVQNIALEQIYRLVTTDHLERPVLDRLATPLDKIEGTENSIADWFRNDYASQVWGFEMDKQDPERLERKRELFAEISEEYGKLVEDSVRQSDRVTRDLKRKCEFLIACAEDPDWEIPTQAHQQEQQELIESVFPLLREFTVHEESIARYRVMTAKLALTRIVTARARYKLDHGEFPGELSGLVPNYLDSVPIDPFTGEEFRALYSVGPDGKDDGGRILYDLRNGTFSEGDVFLR